MAGEPLIHPVTRRRSAVVPLVIVLLAVLALTVSASPVLPAPVPPGGRPSPGTLASGASPPRVESVTVAPAFAPGTNALRVGPVPSGTEMDVLVGLASRDPAGLAGETAALYTVGSGSYHHFLPPREVAARFGPAPAAQAGAQQYFAGFGLASRALGSGSLLSVRGPAGEIAAAFGTTFDEYRSLSGRLFVSHPSPAVLPAGLPWTGAVGLGNVSLPVPLARSGAPATTYSSVGPAAACTSGSVGLSPCQIWGAYDANTLISAGTNGSGERIGLVDVYDGREPQPTLASDLAQFNSTFHLPFASVSYNYPVNTSVNLNATSTGWGLEEVLDLQWSHAAAPGASIAMTFAPNSNVGLYEAVDWLVGGHRVDVISLSWGEPDVGVFNPYAGPCGSACNATTDGSYEVLGPVLAAAALEGITVLAASGDCGSADGTAGVSTNYPSSDPFVTGVGGTSLSVSASGAWLGELAWSGNASGAVSPGCQNGGGSGGGFAPFPRPWWQTGAGVPASPPTRGDPDVAGDASTFVEVVQGGSPTSVGGTSLATPLWAGFTALADQYAHGALGFLNPSLYSILRGTNYSVDFHDIVSGTNGYAAGSGWDPVTGIGTPIVGYLVHDLARPPVSPSSYQVGLGASPVLGAAPLNVSFELLPSGGTGRYPLEGIDFGDGTSALTPTGIYSHVYAGDGVYPAIGYGVDSSGNVSASAPVAVVVGGSSLRVTLTVSNRSPGVGAPDDFNVTATGGTAPYSYLFAFGDGTFLNGSLANATTHRFGAAGGYCADVIAIDSAHPSSGGTSAIVPIAVGGAAATICATSLSTFTVVAQANPGVRDAPAEYPTLFRVTGGNGGAPPTEVLSSSDPYVGACACTIFRDPGRYSVTLTATNSSGARASNETNVTVAPPLGGTFSTSSLYGPAPWTVNFSAAVAGGYQAAAARTVWTFGDGGSSLGSTASHSYASAGFYFASADVEDSGQGNASEGFLIDVLPPGRSPYPAVGATISPAVNVVPGTKVDFSAETNGTTAPVLFNWSLGSGDSALAPRTSSTLLAPFSGALRARTFWLNVSWPLVHQRVSAVIFDPTLVAVQSGGFVPRTDALTFVASAGPSYGTSPMPWTGSASATGPGSPRVSWNLGNGLTSTGSSAQELYGTPGDYTASANATDSWNDSALLPFGIAVRSSQPVVVQASVSTDRGTAPLTVSLQAAASGGAGAPYGYVWSFGNGASAVGPAASAIYSSVGSYNLSVTVTDSMGASAQENWTIQVVSRAAPPTNGGGLPLDLYLGAGVAAGAVVALAIVGYARRRREPPPASP